jgi:hypothetical protein
LSLFVLLKRDFWGLFGGIWMLVGLVFLVIGAPIAVSKGEPEGYVFAALGLVSAATGGALLRRGLERARVEQYLRREGLTADGEVMAVQETNVRYNRRIQWQLRYRYEDRMGAAHEGRSGYLEPEEAGAWSVGDKGVVRFDPHQPSRLCSSTSTTAGAGSRRLRWCRQGSHTSRGLRSQSAREGWPRG